MPATLSFSLYGNPLFLVTPSSREMELSELLAMCSEVFECVGKKNNTNNQKTCHKRVSHRMFPSQNADAWLRGEFDFSATFSRCQTFHTRGLYVVRSIVRHSPNVCDQRKCDQFFFRGKISSAKGVEFLIFKFETVFEISKNQSSGSNDYIPVR